MNHLKVLGGIALAGLLVATGCGTTPVSGPAVSAATDLAGRTIEVAGVWSGEEQENFESVLHLFEQRTGAKVKYTSAGDDLPTVLQTRVDGKTPPNIAMLPQPGLVAQLARAGAIKPLSDRVEQLLDENYDQYWRDLGSVGGRPYAVYFKAADKSLFWYNTRLFEEARVEPPKTLDELTRIAGVLGDNGIPPISVGGADGWVLTDWFENLYLLIAGADKYDELSRREIPWTDPSVAETLRAMADLLSDTRLVGGTAGTLQTDFPKSVGQVFTQEPKGAMVFEGDFVGGVISSETAAKPGVDAKVFPFPDTGKGNRGMVAGGDAAVAFTDDPATDELMRFLASPDAAKVWAGLGGFLSPSKALRPEDYPEPLSRQFAEQLLAAGENVRFDMSDLAPSAFGATKGAGEWKALQDFLAHPDDIDAAMRQLESSAAATY